MLQEEGEGEPSTTQDVTLLVTYGLLSGGAKQLQRLARSKGFLRVKEPWVIREFLKRAFLILLLRCIIYLCVLLVRGGTWSQCQTEDAIPRALLFIFSGTASIHFDRSPLKRMKCSAAVPGRLLSVFRYYQEPKKSQHVARGGKPATQQKYMAVSSHFRSVEWLDAVERMEVRHPEYFVVMSLFYATVAAL